MKSKIIYSNEYYLKQSEKSQVFGNFSSLKNSLANWFTKKKFQDNDLLLFIQSICEFLKVSNDLAFCIEFYRSDHGRFHALH